MVQRRASTARAGTPAVASAAASRQADSRSPYDTISSCSAARSSACPANPSTRPLSASRAWASWSWNGRAAFPCSRARPTESCRASCSSTMRRARATSPPAAAAAPANKASVTPASADTTTTGRGPPWRRTMVTTRVNAAASATDVPPNLRIVTSLTVVCKARPTTRLVSSWARVAGTELPLDLAERRPDLDGRIGVGGAGGRLLVVARHGVGILEEVPGEHRHDALLPADHAVPQQLPRAGHAGRARRLASDAGAVHDRLGLENLLVRDGGDDAVRLPNRTHRPVVGRRVADVDRAGDGVRLDTVTPREPLPETRREGSRPFGLHRREPRRVADEPPLARFGERLPERRRVAKVARGQHDPVRRRPVELLQQLEHDRLLSLDAKRVDRVEQVQPEPLARLLGEGEARVEVAAHEQRAGAVGDRLAQLAERHLALRHQHQGRKPGEAGVRGERGPGVARRRARQRRRADTAGPRDRHGHPPVLERSRGGEPPLL